MNLRPEDRLLQFASLTFDVSVGDLVAVLTSGAACIVAPEGVNRLGEGLMTALSRTEPTVLSISPSGLAMLDTAEIPGVRRVVSAGEVLNGALAAEWSVRAEVINAYGPTETTVFATSHSYDRPGDAPIGRAVPGTFAYVLDGLGRPVEAGAVGELCLGGAGVARGYLGRPGLTADWFVPDPFSEVPGSRLYRTGDLARQDPDGSLHYLGRGDDQVKVHGYRIELGEIEAHLAGHPAVASCAVTVSGQDGQQRLTAYATIKPGADAPSAREIRHWLSRRIPAYMIPSAVRFLDAMPITSSGKLDRAALNRSATGTQSTPQGTRTESTGTQIEHVLAEIWAGVFGVDQVGPEQDFFDLGGDSLQAVQIAFRVREALNLPLKPVDVQMNPSVAELAALVNRMCAAAGTHVVPEEEC
jgi:acyl-coenzyme A synthetase/AMP-(fatty) acid ligase/acyl carrier protein